MQLRKVLLITGGILCLILGILGIFLPLLPTTIFFLLAAAAFVRSSDKLYHWLMNHRLFGAYIRNYRLYHAVTLQSKIITLVFLWIVIGYSAIAIVSAWWIRVMLAIIAIGVTWHILSLKTLTKQMLDDHAEQQKSAESLPGGESSAS